MHAAVRVVQQRARIFRALETADHGRSVVVVAHDDVGAAASRVLHADQVQRKRAGDVAVAAIHENGTDLAARLQERHGFCHGRSIPVGNVDVVAAAVDRDHDRIGRKVGRDLEGSDIVFLSFLAAQLAVGVGLDRIDRRAVRLDAQRHRQIGAADPIEHDKAGAMHEIGEPDQARDGVAIGIGGPDRAVLDGAQRKELARARYVAVAVIRDHDDVGRGVLAELFELGAQLAQHPVVRAKRVARVCAADAKDVLRSIGIADPYH